MVVLPKHTIHLLDRKGRHVTQFYYPKGACECGIAVVTVAGYWNSAEAAQAACARGDVAYLLAYW
jgi:hypothetical protein